MRYFAVKRAFVCSRGFFTSAISTRQNPCRSFAPRRTRTSKLNDLFLQWTRDALQAESGKLPVGLVPSRSTKAGHLAEGVTWRGAEGNGARVLTRVFVMELMASVEGYGKHYSGGKATRQEIMVSRSLGSTRDRITPWTGDREASGLLGITIGILEHMLSALHSRAAFDESYRLLDRLENTRMTLLSILETTGFLHDERREEMTEEKVNCDKSVPWP